MGKRKSETTEKNAPVFQKKKVKEEHLGPLSPKKFKLKVKTKQESSFSSASPKVKKSVNGSPKKVKKKETLLSDGMLPVKCELSEPTDQQDILIPSDIDVDPLAIPKPDLKELLERIQKSLPESDNLMPKTRIKKMNWNEIAFGEYNADQCMKLWESVQKRQRQYRTLRELLIDAVEWVEKPWQNAKSKGVKNHPEFPKRPKSAFLLFLSESKADILRENEGVKMVDMSRIAGMKYNSLPASVKSSYIERAAFAMKKYEEEVKRFYNKHPELEEHPKFTGPKRAQTPFTLFLENHLSKEEFVRDKNDYRMASKEAWNNLKPSKKLKWIRLALAAHKQYLEEVKIYNLQHPTEPIKPLKTVLSKDEVEILDKADGKPKKPPASTYLLYSQNMIRNDVFSKMDAKDRVKAIAAKWKELSPAERSKYEKQLQTLQENYLKEFQAYWDKLPEDEKINQEQPKHMQPKQPKVKEKKPKLSKREISMQAVPKNWEMMTPKDKEKYMSAMSQVRDYFEAKLEESMRHGGAGSDADEDQKSEEESENEASSDESD